MSLNTREVALLVWLCVLLAWSLRFQNVRRSFAALIRTSLHPILLRFFVLASAYVAVGVWMLCRLNLWNLDLLKTTILWFVGGSGIAAVMTSGRDGYASIWQIVGRTIAFTALLEFVVNAYTFPLVVELIALPIIFLAVGAQAVSKTLPEFSDPKFDPTRTLLAVIIALYGFILLGFSLWSAVTHLGEIASIRSLKEFALPIFLTIWFVPFIYLMRVYAVVEQALVGVRVQLGKESGLYVRARSRIVTAIGLDLRRAQFFREHFAWGFYDVTDERGLNDRIAAFKDAWATRAPRAPHAT